MHHLIGPIDRTLHVSLDGPGDYSARVYRGLLDGDPRRPARSPGERLPPTRVLAAQPGAVAQHRRPRRTTGSGAEGFVVGRVGAGTFVTEAADGASRDGAAGRGAEPVPARPAPSGRVPGRLRPRPGWVATPQPASSPGPTPRLDFRVGIPDARLFPFQTWRRLVAAELRLGADHPAAYAEPGGHPPLREEIARYVGVGRSVRATPDDVVVTNGAQQAIDLIGRVLVSPGDVVAVEEPGYPPVRDAARPRSGARVVGVPVDGEGLVVDAAARREPGWSMRPRRTSSRSVRRCRWPGAGRCWPGPSATARRCRGRLRQRVPVLRAAAGAVAEPGHPGPGDLRRHLLQDAAAVAAGRLPGGAARPAPALVAAKQLERHRPVRRPPRRPWPPSWRTGSWAGTSGGRLGSTGNGRPGSCGSSRTSWPTSSSSCRRPPACTSARGCGRATWSGPRPPVAAAGTVDRGRVAGPLLRRAAAGRLRLRLRLAALRDRRRRPHPVPPAARPPPLSPAARPRPPPRSSWPSAPGLAVGSGSGRTFRAPNSEPTAKPGLDGQGDQGAGRAPAGAPHRRATRPAASAAGLGDQRFDRHLDQPAALEVVGHGQAAEHARPPRPRSKPAPPSRWTARAPARPTVARGQRLGQRRLERPAGAAPRSRATSAVAASSSAATGRRGGPSDGPARPRPRAGRGRPPASAGRTVPAALRRTRGPPRPAPRAGPRARCWSPRAGRRPPGRRPPPAGGAAPAASRASGARPPSGWRPAAAGRPGGAQGGDAGVELGRRVQHPAAPLGHQPTGRGRASSPEPSAPAAAHPPAVRSTGPATRRPAG